MKQLLIKKTIYFRQCWKCNDFYRTTAKRGKFCEKCLKIANESRKQKMRERWNKK